MNCVMIMGVKNNFSENTGTSLLYRRLLDAAIFVNVWIVCVCEGSSTSSFLNLCFLFFRQCIGGRICPNIGEKHVIYIFN